MQGKKTDPRWCYSRPPGCGCPCQSGSVHGWTRGHAAARAAQCCGRDSPDDSETRSDCHPHGPRMTSNYRHSRFLHITNVHFFPSWSENQDGKVAVEQKQNRQKEVRWSEQAGRRVTCDQLQWERLPISWLNAQPFTVTALVWSEADTRKPRERLQTTNNDGLLTRGYRHNQDKLRMVARFHLDLDYGILLILYAFFPLCFDFKITLYLL